MKLTKLRIKNHHLFKDADINLKNSDGEVLNTVVLAGSNGSGKTTLLKMIYDILTYENNQHDSSLEFTLENIADLKIKNMVYKLKEEFGNDKLYNKNYIFNRLYQKKLNEDLENKKIKLIYMPTEINFSNMNVETRNYTNQYKFSNIIDQNIINDIPSFLVTKINSEIYKNEDLPIKQAIKKICDEINIIYSILDLDIKMIGVKKDEENLPLFKNKFGAEFDINSLSSGEKQLFVRAMTLKMLNVNNSIILIDEPEISLHPKWQQRVVKVYENIGENNQIIIATHSPHVVSSVKVESLKLLSKSSDDGVEIIDGENLDGALGLPVDVVLKELMGVDTIRDPEVEEKLKYLRDLVRRDKFLTVEFKESYNELKELLGTIDQDMILIDMAIARKKGERSAKY